MTSGDLTHPSAKTRRRCLIDAAILVVRAESTSSPAICRKMREATLQGAGVFGIEHLVRSR